MRLKKQKTNKTERFTIRCTQDEAYKIEGKANIYTDGNISEYLLYAALNFVPGKSDFDTDKKEKRKSKRKR